MPLVKLHTSLGNIQIELDEQATPETTQNFIKYVRAGFYNGTIFHRVIKNFMIQGGGFGTDMQQKEANSTISNEAKTGLKNKKGTISMARTNAPHSASSQFFINVADNDFLYLNRQTPSGFVFCDLGRSPEGHYFFIKISHPATTRRSGHEDVPTEDIFLLSAEEVPAE
jgi:peptidyl-prolyl cis-trans isomerase B (cyclophilin B)